MSRLIKKINAKKGDVVLTANYPLAYEALKVIGGYWGHCGMVMDDNGTTIRHCNFHIDKIKMNWNTMLGIKLFPKSFVPENLSNGLPGFITQTIEEAFLSKNPDFSKENGFILRPKPEKEEGYRPLLHKIADKMANLDGFYRLNAYVNINQQDDSNQRINNKGTICSGAIYFAHKFCGKEMNLVEIPTEKIKEGAENIYKYLWTMAKQKYGVLGVSLMKITDVGESMANQVVNTYIADRSLDISKWWKNNIESGLTIAPDHLLPKGVFNPDGNAIGVQNEDSSYYGEIVPIEISEELIELT